MFLRLREKTFLLSHHVLEVDPRSSFPVNPLYSPQIYILKTSFTQPLTGRWSASPEELSTSGTASCSSLPDASGKGGHGSSQVYGFPAQKLLRRLRHEVYKFYYASLGNLTI